MNPLPAAIGAIAEKRPVVAAGPAPLTTGSAEPATSAAKTAPAEPPTASAAAESTTAALTGKSRSGSRNPTCARRPRRAGLSVVPKTLLSTRSKLKVRRGPAQSEIVLPGLQRIADGSVHQKRLVRIPRCLRTQVWRRGGSQLIEFVFGYAGGSSESVLLPGARLRRLTRSLLAGRRLRLPIAWWRSESSRTHRRFLLIAFPGCILSLRATSRQFTRLLGSLGL